jgi:hypothetical protein
MLGDLLINDATSSDATFRFWQKTHSFWIYIESDMYKNEEHSEGGEVEVDLMVALESHLIEPEVTPSIGIFFNVTNVFGKAKRCYLF